MQREFMEFDVVVVGAGPAGLAAACRLALDARAEGRAISVCVVEKGAEVGAHILSGAVFDSRALDELFPDWRERGAPLHTRVAEDELYLLRDAHRARRLPAALVPESLHNSGHYIVSLGNLCRWLAEQAQALGVEIYPGFAAAEVLYREDGAVAGIVTGDMGRGRDGEPGPGFMPGMELRARYTLFAEGCRGHLGKQLIARFGLDRGRDPQHYGLGLKELWDLDPAKYRPGRVIHGAGWPLGGEAGGGFFLYHGEGGQAVVGLIVDLDYRNPWLSPFEEFQRLKTHPLLAAQLEGGRRVAYGARAIAKGGFNALVKMTMPGALLIGCDAGTLDVARIKGSHTAMKSGLLAAEAVGQALAEGDEGGRELVDFERRYRDSWLFDELYRGRNAGPALRRLGPWAGGAFNWAEQTLFGGRLPFTLHCRRHDAEGLQPAAASRKIDYPRPDGVLSFDRLSSVHLANVGHREDQPCHLQLADPALPVRDNLPRYAEPAQRYCPAGVYEIVAGPAGERLQINGQNCLHCKSCDIKDPAGNIHWTPPEGGGGPRYPNM